MKNVFSQKMFVDDTLVDYDLKVPITEILRIMQLVTFNHSNEMGLDHTSMIEKNNAFWVVTKIKLLLNDDIKSMDKINVKTWTMTPGLVRFDRNCMIKVGNKVKAKGRVEWCCLDYTTHRPRKASSIVYPDLEMAEKTEIKTEYSNLKLEMTEKDYVYTRKIRSCDIDVNFHTNNLKYNFMALDSFSVDELQHMSIKEYEIYYVNQSYEGDEIDVFKRALKNQYYIEGKIKDKTIFRVVIKFKKK